MNYSKLPIVQKAVAHILRQAARNRVKVTEEIRKETTWRVQQALLEAERRVIGQIMDAHGPPLRTEPPYTAEDIQVYQSGAFNLTYAAPGPFQEIDDEGKPL